MTTPSGAEPFPSWFFDRDDNSPDPRFYAPTRLVTHIDDGAISAVGTLYAELGIAGSAIASGETSAFRKAQDACFISNAPDWRMPERHAQKLGCALRR